MSKNNSSRPNRHRLVRLFFRVVIIVAIVAVLFFGLAGRLDWYAGWGLIVVFFAYLLFIGIWGRRNDPELIAERTSNGEGVKTWDKVLMAFYTVLLLVLLIVSILDGARYQWTHVPAWLSFVGWLGCLFAGWLIWRVMKENTFLSSQVRIQEERGHFVVSTGPYSIVRHPMYLGVIIFLLCVPLVLGSILGFVIGILTAALFVVRTILEDRMLMEELDGYRDYAHETPWRLIPKVW